MIKRQVILCFLCILVMMSGRAMSGSLPAFVAPKSMSVTVVADNMVFNGMKMKSAEFSARGSVEDLIAFYHDEWDDKVKETKVGEVLVLSHYDGEFMFVVQIQKRKSALRSSGRQGALSTGLLSISEPGSVPARLDLGKGFPMLSSTKVVNDIANTDLGKQSRTLLLYNPRSVQDNLKFYKRQFAQKGWTELPQETHKPVSGNATLIMNKGGDELNMAFSAIDGETSVVAVIVEK